jgi:hypothetical protein
MSTSLKPATLVAQLAEPTGAHLDVPRAFS